MGGWIDGWMNRMTGWVDDGWMDGKGVKLATCGLNPKDPGGNMIK